MTNQSRDDWWIAFGAPPYGAARELVDRPNPPTHDSVFRHNLTVIYKTFPAKEWRSELERIEDGWRAEFVGSKRVYSLVSLTSLVHYLPVAELRVVLTTASGGGL